MTVDAVRISAVVPSLARRLPRHRPEHLQLLGGEVDVVVVRAFIRATGFVVAAARGADEVLIAGLEFFQSLGFLVVVLDWGIDALAETVAFDGFGGLFGRTWCQVRLGEVLALLRDHCPCAAAAVGVCGGRCEAITAVVKTLSNGWEARHAVLWALHGGGGITRDKDIAVCVEQ